MAGAEPALVYDSAKRPLPIFSLFNSFPLSSGKGRMGVIDLSPIFPQILWHIGTHPPGIYPARMSHLSHSPTPLIRHPTDPQGIYSAEVGGWRKVRDMTTDNPAGYIPRRCVRLSVGFLS